MLCLTLLRVYLVAIISVSAEDYIVSSCQTDWTSAQCTLAEPTLSYQNKTFIVNKTLDSLPIDTDVWIGYASTKLPFLLLGYAHLEKAGSITYDVIHIGFCQNICNRSIFGIQLPHGINNNSPNKCRCVEETISVRSKQCLDDYTNTRCYAIYKQTSVNSNLVAANETGDCFLYNYPHFHWQQCNQASYPKILCSNDSHLHGSLAKASDINTTSRSWVQGNKKCMSENMHPAFIESIRNAGFGYTMAQFFWTGIFRSNTLIKRSNHVISRTKNAIDIHPAAEYAYIDKRDTTIHFVKTGFKQALCVKGKGYPLANESCIERTTVGPQLTTQIKTETKELPALGVGLGVSAGLVVTLGVAVIIVVLRKRQKQSGCKKTKSNESDINSSLDVKRDQAGQIGHTVSNHNYFVLEKHTISADEHIDHHKNAPGETYSTIVEENDYHSINEDPRANAKDDCDDYDYTTNKASASGGMSHDTVYNKLKLERQGDYDHVKGFVHIDSRITNSDYDTTVTSTARSGYGIGDYDHVKKMGEMLKAASGNDYDTTVSLAAYERKKGERGEEHNYNHTE